MADLLTWAEPGLKPFLPVRAIILLCHDLSRKEHGHKHCCHMLSTYRCLTSVQQAVLNERPVGRCLVPGDWCRVPGGRLLLSPALALAAGSRSPAWDHTDKVKDGPEEACGLDCGRRRC